MRAINKYQFISRIQLESFDFLSGCSYGVRNSQREKKKLPNKKLIHRKSFYLNPKTCMNWFDYEI